ncbi:MAG: ATP-grasp domain-containing protein [Bacteroidetes bacterium]|nr:ATP-grasp domain-containing protein [Bacteroidota bacterium]
MKKTIMIFGAGENQLTLIQSAVELGFHTVVIDPNPDAPGRESADVFEVVAAKDYNRTREIALLHGVEGIVTSQMENPLPLMARLAEDLHFIFPSVDSVRKARNKFLMKQDFLENGVPCARGILVGYNETLHESSLRGFSFPLIIKPTDAFSSRGVYKVGSWDQLSALIGESRSFSSTGEILIEEFMEGPEVSVESVTCRGNTTVVQITDKVITDYPYTVEMAHIQPSSLPADTKEEIIAIVKNGITALGLDHCITHAELKKTPQGVKFVEIGARLGGDYISSYLVFHSTGCNIEKCAIQVALGIEPDIRIPFRHGSEIQYLGLPAGMKVQKVMPLDEVFTSPGVIKVSVSIRPGETIPMITNSAKRSGFVICRGNSREEAHLNAEQAIVRLKNCIELSA